VVGLPYGKDEMTDEQFERWLKRNGITGMAAFNASMARKQSMKVWRRSEESNLTNMAE
jgi:hypothetical protein